MPDAVHARLAPYEDDPAGLRAEGIAMAAELCEALLDAGAPGLHFYTLNRSRATREIFSALRISPLILSPVPPTGEGDRYGARMDPSLPAPSP